MEVVLRPQTSDDCRPNCVTVIRTTLLTCVYHSEQVLVQKQYNVSVFVLQNHCSTTNRARGMCFVLNGYLTYILLHAHLQSNYNVIFACVRVCVNFAISNPRRPAKLPRIHSSEMIAIPLLLCLRALQTRPVYTSQQESLWHRWKVLDTHFGIVLVARYVRNCCFHGFAKY